jgi:hypothetical protein
MPDKTSTPLANSNFEYIEPPPHVKLVEASHDSDLKP